MKSRNDESRGALATRSDQTSEHWRNPQMLANRIKREIPTAAEIEGVDLAEQASAASFISGIQGALRQTKSEVSGKQEEWMQCSGEGPGGGGMDLWCGACAGMTSGEEAEEG
jgi:hypothetical protein